MGQQKKKNRYVEPLEGAVATIAYERRKSEEATTLCRRKKK